MSHIKPKTEYVLGLMFNRESRDIILITKREASPFPGMLNGVGGHIEGDEDRHLAMSREFFEETGISTAPLFWFNFGTIVTMNSIIHCFHRYVSQPFLVSASTTTDESVGIYNMDDVLAGRHNVVPSIMPLLAAIRYAVDARIAIIAHD